MSIIYGDTYHRRDLVTLVATRQYIHAEAYASHLELVYPPNIRKAHVLSVGHEVGHAYNALFAEALKTDFPYALTLEDDMLPPFDALERLYATVEANPQFSAVSGYYRNKEDPGLPLILGFPEVDGDSSIRSPTGGVMECNIIPMGFALWKLDMLRALDGPWFETTLRETQDVNFCRRARKAGFRFAVDSSLRIGHLDVTTGKVY